MGDTDDGNWKGKKQDLTPILRFWLGEEMLRNAQQRPSHTAEGHEKKMGRSDRSFFAPCFGRETIVDTDASLRFADCLVLGAFQDNRPGHEAIKATFRGLCDPRAELLRNLATRYVVAFWRPDPVCRQCRHIRPSR